MQSGEHVQVLELLELLVQAAQLGQLGGPERAAWRQQAVRGNQAAGDTCEGAHAASSGHPLLLRDPVVWLSWCWVCLACWPEAASWKGRHLLLWL